MSKDNFEHTKKVVMRGEDEDNEARQILLDVYQSLREKGYNPVHQLVGHLLSGDPAYIPATTMPVALSASWNGTSC